MINELLWLGLALLTFTSIIIIYRLFGKNGLFVFAGIGIVQVLKTVQLFGLVATLGNIIYGASFLITDILSENHGKKDAQKAIKIGLVVAVLSTAMMYVCTLFIPHSSDFASGALSTIFTVMPRIMIASLIAYVISNLNDVYVFHKIKAMTGEKWLWFRNVASTFTSQTIDSVIFSFIAFWGMFSNDIFLQIMLTTYLMKLITAIMDTPFVYIAKWMKAKGLVPA